MTTDDKQFYEYSTLTTFAVGLLWIFGVVSFCLLLGGALFLLFGLPFAGIAYLFLLTFHFGVLSKVRHGLDACEMPISELRWYAVLAGIGIPFVGWSGCAYMVLPFFGIKF